MQVQGLKAPLERNSFGLPCQIRSVFDLLSQQHSKKGKEKQAAEKSLHVEPSMLHFQYLEMMAPPRSPLLKVLMMILDAMLCLSVTVL